MSHKETRVSGFKELFHVVRKGDSVSRIAADYRSKGWPVKSWEPIFDITRLRTGLWERIGTEAQRYNPDLIYPGDVLIIPRSSAGYERRIGQLQQLAEAVNKSGNEAAAIRKDAEDFSERLDLISDLLQLVVTCGLSADKAVKAARAAKKATGHRLFELLAAKHEALGEMFLEISKFAGTKAAEMIDPKAGLAAKGATKTIPKGVEIARNAALRAAKGVKAVGLSIAMGADMILDFVNPSEVAKLYIFMRTGEKVDDTLFQAEYREIQSKVKTLKVLGDRITALRAERAYLYGNGLAPDRRD